MNQTAARKKATGVVASMTGYGHGHAEIDSGHLKGVATLEIRTVNSRFVDLQLRLADELRGLEPMLREVTSRLVSRGKVECRLSWRAARSSTAELRIDETLLVQLNAAQARIRQHLPDAAPLTVAEVLQWQATLGDRAAGTQADAAGGGDPGSGPRSEADKGADRPADDEAGNGAAVDAVATLQAACSPLIERIFADCVAARRREGGRLAEVIVQQLDAMQQVAEALRPKIPALLAEAQERLTARLAEALPTEGVVVGREETFARVRQEVALLSLRGDVAEELDRLQVHLDEARQIVRDGGTVGKRLDFLSQELNREANTIASKAVGIAVTDAAVALKLAIEQLREQVQNIE